MINISSDIVSSIVGATSSGFQSLLPIIVLVYSVILAFFGIRKIIYTITLIKR